MPRRADIITFLDSYLEKEKFTDYLPIGLLVEGRDEVRRVATGVSACAEVFEQAIAWNADMIVVHHGMFWDSADRVVRGSLKKRLKLLLDNDVTLLGYHLPLDAHPEIGNNILFARAVGFQNPEPFGEYKGNKIGFRGRLGPIPIEEFAAAAEGFYGAAPRAFLHGKAVIESAAVISGGAWEHTEEAWREGVDCFVTGAADEPVFHLARELETNFLAFGHHATEKPGVRRLGELLGEKFGVETRFFDVENPL